LGGELNFDAQSAWALIFLHRLVGILHQIEKGLLAQTLVEGNERQSAGVVTQDAHRLSCFWFGSEARGNNLQNTIEQSGQVRGMGLRVKRTSEVEKLGDEGAEAVDFGGDISGELAGQF